MSDHADVPQTEAEAIRRGYKRVERIAPDFYAQAFSIQRPCGPLQSGQLCLQTNCRPDNTMTVCYCNGISCSNCYIMPCV